MKIEPTTVTTVQFPATRGTLGIPIAFAVASLVEMIAVHLLIPWAWLSWSTTMASAIVLAGFIVSVVRHRRHPHHLQGDVFTLTRSGRTVASVNRNSIEHVGIHRRYGVVSADITSGRLFLPTQDGTSVDIDLKAPVTAVISSPLAMFRRNGVVGHFSVQADDPDSLVRALRPTP